MQARIAKQLKPGLYRIHWKEGGSSLASVGILYDGTRWYAPANWTSAYPTGVTSTDWVRVASVELLAEARVEKRSS